MNRQEEELLASLRAEFSVEAVERLHAITSGLLELEKDLAVEKQAEVIETIYRQAHSLKGEARAVNGIETGPTEPPLDDYLATRI